MVKLKDMTPDVRYHVIWRELEKCAMFEPFISYISSEGVRAVADYKEFISVPYDVIISDKYGSDIVMVMSPVKNSVGRLTLPDIIGDKIYTELEELYRELNDYVDELADSVSVLFNDEAADTARVERAVRSYCLRHNEAMRRQLMRILNSHARKFHRSYLAEIYRPYINLYRKAIGEVMLVSYLSDMMHLEDDETNKYLSHIYVNDDDIKRFVRKRYKDSEFTDYMAGLVPKFVAEHVLLYISRVYMDVDKSALEYKMIELELS